MSEFETIFSQTQHPNYNITIADRNMLTTYRPTRAQPDHNNSESLPLKRFQEYFGKIKPSFFQELKNIFENSNFQDRSLTLQPDYHVQGTMLASRGKFLKRSKEFKDFSPVSNNHFTIESISARDVYRKAKLNRLILNEQTLHEQDITNDERSHSLLHESNNQAGSLKSSLSKHHKNKIKSMTRSFRVSRSTIERETFLHWINPTNKERLTMVDLNHIICLLHQADLQISPNISYFNVYVEEGNNSELLKSLIRKRNGWRVVELPEVANFIWTQFYRRSVLRKRLHKRQKSENEQEKEKDRSTKMESSKRSKVFSSDKRYEIYKNELAPHKTNDETFSNEVRKLIPPCELEQITKMTRTALKSLKPIQITHNVLIHNHFPNNSCISDKKNLLLHLSRYLESKSRDVFQFFPESYELNDTNHPIMDKLQQESDQHKDYWIIKPGENSNRGRGITISHNKANTIEQLKKRLNEQPGERQNIAQRKKRRSVILQKYLKPLLYNGRKFDIRSYMLVTYFNNQLRMYCYEECYIRTSSKMFDIDSTNRLVHLTNDAIQSHSNEYGKFQEGNKIAESIFAKFIDEEYRRKNSEGHIWHALKEQMQGHCQDVLQSSYQTLLKGVKRQQSQSIDSDSDQNYYFQLFGMDFMIDQYFKLWLIEVNTNPAITHDCSRVLNHLIPRMLDNALAIAVQPIMRPLRLHEIPYSNQFTAVFKKIIL